MMATKGKRKTGKEKKQLATRSYVKRMIHTNQETKYVVSGASGGNAVTNAGYIYDLTLPSAGTGDSNRIGDMISPSFIDLRYAWHGSSTDGSNVVRMILFQCTGLPLATGTSDVGVVLSATGLSSVYAPLSAYNQDNRNRYRVLYDRTFNLVYGASNQQVVGHARIGAKKLRRIQWNTASGATNKGGLQLLLISDSGAVTHPTYDNFSKIYYKDA